MSFQDTFQQSLDDLGQLLFFLREVKRTYKDLSQHSETYALKCFKTVERAKILMHPEHQILHTAVLTQVKTLASGIGGQAAQLKSIHGRLKELVGVIKDTKRGMEQGVKLSADRLKTAKKAWDKAEAQKQKEPMVWSETDPMACVKAVQMKSEATASLECAERGKLNYVAVVGETERLIEGYVRCVEELKTKGVIAVKESICVFGARSPQVSFPPTRSPLKMIKSQSSYCASNQSLESGQSSLPFGDLSAISKKSQFTTSPTCGSILKMQEHLMTSSSSHRSHA